MAMSGHKTMAMFKRSNKIDLDDGREAVRKLERFVSFEPLNPRTLDPLPHSVRSRTRNGGLRSHWRKAKCHLKLEFDKAQTLL